MPLQNTVFAQSVKLVPLEELRQLSQQYGTDYRTRHLTTERHFLALFYAQLSGAQSLRAVTEGLESQQDLVARHGLVDIKRATLSDANNNRNADVFAELFARMVVLVSGRSRKLLSEATYLLDATVIKFGGHGSQWAHYGRKGYNAAKVHVVYDCEHERPTQHSVTTARTNDMRPAQKFEITPGATYVFDLGYYSYSWWEKLDRNTCRFVTRLKKGTKLLDVEERTPSGTPNIKSDRTGTLPKRIANGKRNPYKKPVREVIAQLDDGKKTASCH